MTKFDKSEHVKQSSVLPSPTSTATSVVHNSSSDFDSSVSLNQHTESKHKNLLHSKVETIQNNSNLPPSSCEDARSFVPSTNTTQLNSPTKGRINHLHESKVDSVDRGSSVGAIRRRRSRTTATMATAHSTDTLNNSQSPMNKLNHHQEQQPQNDSTNLTGRKRCGSTRGLVGLLAIGLVTFISFFAVEWSQFATQNSNEQSLNDSHSVSDTIKRTEKKSVIEVSSANDDASSSFYTADTALSNHGMISDSFLSSQTLERVTQVWWFAWLTAVSTGLGVLPFVFVRKIPTFWLGVCNAAAGGMMIAASIGLVFEACTQPTHKIDMKITFLSYLNSLPAVACCILGAVAGLLFILATKTFLEKYEHLKFGHIQGLDAKKVLLVMAVMTLHSCTEGVAIGVSFGGETGHVFGLFIAATLAIHNVPEGVATSLVLVPRGVPLIDAAVWSVITSIPQPIMAVPAFIMVETFLPFLPFGLGFAAGAMFWVALLELLPEANSEIGLRSTLLTCAGAGILMGAAQIALKE